VSAERGRPLSSGALRRAWVLPVPLTRLSMIACFTVSYPAVARFSDSAVWHTASRWSMSPLLGLLPRAVRAE
jgi:hypothetical protein